MFPTVLCCLHHTPTPPSTSTQAQLPHTTSSEEMHSVEALVLLRSPVIISIVKVILLHTYNASIEEAGEAFEEIVKRPKTVIRREEETERR